MGAGQRHGGHARQGLDGAEGIAERPGRLDQLRSLHVEAGQAGGRADGRPVGRGALFAREAQQQRRRIAAGVVGGEQRLELRRLHGDRKQPAGDVGGESTVGGGLCPIALADRHHRPDHGTARPFLEHLPLERRVSRRRGRDVGGRRRRRAGVDRRGSLGLRVGCRDSARFGGAVSVGGAAVGWRKAEARGQEQREPGHGNVATQIPS